MPSVVVTIMPSSEQIGRRQALIARWTAAPVCRIAVRQHDRAGAAAPLAAPHLRARKADAVQVVRQHHRGVWIARSAMRWPLSQKTSSLTYVTASADVASRLELGRAVS